jgi:hypothetical protein
VSFVLVLIAMPVLQLPVGIVTPLIVASEVQPDISLAIDIPPDNITVRPLCLHSNSKNVTPVAGVRVPLKSPATTTHVKTSDAIVASKEYFCQGSSVLVISILKLFPLIYKSHHA